VDVWVGDDARQFVARAEGFLTERLERNVLATTLSGVIEGRHEHAIFAVGLDSAGVTVGAAVRTPPNKLLATGFEDIADARALLDLWFERDPDLPGVSAEPATAEAITAAWIAATGGGVRVEFSELMQVLDRVVEPVQRPSGLLRPATIKDQAQLEDWAAAFAAETGLGHAEAMGHQVDARIMRGQLHVWDRDGVNAAMVGHSELVGAVVRVGPVYTPPEVRGHGYATAATATLSQRLLDAGAARCMLFTDATNAVSNHVYAKIGYVHHGEWQERAFLPQP
jgi:predicted GNAT family acetyltransferase